MTRRRVSFLEGRAVWMAAGLGGTIVHIVAAKPIYSLSARVAAVVLLLSMLAAIRRFIHSSHFEGPLLPLVTVQLYVTYAVAQFRDEPLLLVHGAYMPRPESIAIACWLCAVASLVVQVAGRFASAQAEKLDFSRFFPTPRREFVRPASALLLISTLAAFMLTFIGIPSAIRNLANVFLNPYLALVMCVYLAHRFERPLLLRFSYLSMWMLAFLGLLAGFLENTIVPFYLMFITTWVARRTLKTSWLVIALAAVIVLQPAKNEYRKSGASLRSVTTLDGVVDRLRAWEHAIIDAWSDPFSRDEQFAAAAARANFLLQFAQVVEWVPEVVEYRRATALVNGVAYFVPRMLWPEKPSISDLVNNPYALEFHQTTEEGLSRVTIGMLQPADGYWDWGTPGAIVYMAVTGMLYGFLAGNVRATAPHAASRAIVAITLSAFAFQALVSLVNLAVAILPQLIGIWIAMRLLDRIAENPRRHDDETSQVSSSRIDESGFET